MWHTLATANFPKAAGLLHSGLDGLVATVVAIKFGLSKCLEPAYHQDNIHIAMWIKTCSTLA